MGILSKFQRAYRRDGFSGAVRLAARNLAVLPAALRRAEQKTSWFDEKYGVDTDAWVEVEDLGVASDSRTFAYNYAPSPTKIWEEAMALLNIEHSAFTFIDLGSGKGRALLLAAAYPFRRIIGVEFSAALHSIAMRNLEMYSGPRRCPQVQCVCDDAAEFQFPEGPLVILLYNPFLGEIMRRVVRNIEEAVTNAPRPIYVVYINPVHRESLEESRVFGEIARTDHIRIFAAGQ